jgi:glutathione S-transferase
MDQLMNINDWYLFQGVSDTIAFERLVGPKLRGSTPNEAVIAAAMPKAKTVFDEIARLLGAHSYLTGETLSLADIIIAPHMDFLASTPEWTPLTANHPNLQTWLTRMTARPSMTATTWPRVTAMAQAA